ncbi:MAG: DUF6263 family protein [Pirellulales bacterium]
MVSLGRPCSLRRSRSLRRGKSHLLAGAVIGLLLAAPLLAADEPLRWKWSAGQSLRATWKQRVETETAIGEKPLRLLIDSTFVQDWQVAEVEPSGVARVQQSFRRLAVRLEMPPAEPLDYDTTRDTEPTGELRPLAAALSPLVGPSWTVRLTPRGEVLDVTPSPQLQEALKKVAADGRLQGLFAGATGADFLRRSLVVLPEQPLQEGVSWQVQSPVESPVGRVTIQSTYTGRGTEKRGTAELTVIESTGTLEWQPAAGGQARNRRITDQSCRGQLLFDSAAGRLVESQQKQTLKSESRVREQLLEVRLTSEVRLMLEPAE